MKSVVLVEEPISLASADNPKMTCTYGSLYQENEELHVDCHDCFDTMIKIYEFDKARYYCENCDLVIPGEGV